jgi:hypothetical protein
VCEEWAFEERDRYTVFFEEFVDAKLFADKVQYVLRIRD